ncbi:MAG TPA: hypothetical protein VKD71_02465 [Gemmataceae bacterium]|nr:hypothetical protein [Gemmataceae bacterium]
MRLRLLGLLFLMAAVPAAADDNKEADAVRALRAAVLKDLCAKEDKSKSVAAAYKQLFTHVGLTGLKKLADDEDISIALQASWELHRKAVKRDPPIVGRTDWVFDPKPMAEFLRIAYKRMKEEPPVWWLTALLQGDAWPDSHHAFIDLGKDLPAAPKVEVGKDEVTITTGSKSFKLAKTDYDKAEPFGDSENPPAVLWGADLSVVARPGFRGYPFEAVGVETTSARRLWTANVWAARRGVSTGPPGTSPVELRRRGDTVIVYGCESHGLYAEGFDVKTGECQLRFCTCYWFNFSEKWGLK